MDLKGRDFLTVLDYNEEERYDCKGGELFGNQRRFPGHLFWDFQV